MELFQVDIALSLGTPFTSFHHHLMYMLEKVTSKAGKRLGGGEGEGGGGKTVKEGEASSLKLCINTEYGSGNVYCEGIKEHCNHFGFWCSDVVVNALYLGWGIPLGNH